eukprot:gene9594-19946_t
MDTVTQVRANQTQMSLSLIATVFLPMTFLAGVCVHESITSTLHVYISLSWFIYFPVLNFPYACCEPMTVTIIVTVTVTVTVGVFGMNFTIDGGYTDPLLNRQKGPLFFWMMCLAVLLLNVMYFIRKGWLSLRIPSIFSDPKRDTSVALEEEARRKAETAKRRNISAFWPLDSRNLNTSNRSSYNSSMHGSDQHIHHGGGGALNNMIFKTVRSTSFIMGPDSRPLMKGINSP